MSGDADDALDDLEGYDGNAMLEILRTYGRAELPQFLLGGLASIFSRSMELVPAFVIGVALDGLFFQSRDFASAIPFVPAAWIPTSTYDQLVLTVGLIGGAYLLGALLSWVNSWAWNHFSQHLQHAVRTDAYDAMQGMELSFFDDRQTGEVMSILNNDVNRLENFLTSRLNSGIRIVVRVGGMGLVMLLLNWQLALIPVVCIPLLGLVSYGFVRIIHPKYRAVRSSVGALNSRLENNLGGIEVIKAYNREGFESGRVEDASREYLDANWSAITTRIRFFPTIRVITAIGFVATFFVGGLWVLFGPPAPFSGTLTAGTLVTFVLYTRRFMHPMRQFGQIINEYQYAQAASDRILGLMAAPRTIAERPDAVDLGTVAGRVEYDGVWFRYGGDDAWILRDVSFDVEPGEMVGVVGSTGAGKTTLIKLLMRFYDVEEGSVRIDGTDVRDATLSSLREAISYVGQDPYLFYGTVRENIAYGDETIDDASVEAAARTAGAHEFVANLPEGYDTMVGERGVKLSGGQRQRVSLARAVLRDPDILILDEATSHVDNETEMLIQNSLDDLIAERTTFAIAHRLSTVRDADQILVMDRGELVERGTHDELIDADGLYANLWSVQVGELDALPPEFVERTARRHAEIGDD